MSGQNIEIAPERLRDAASRMDDIAEKLTAAKENLVSILANLPQAAGGDKFAEPFRNGQNGDPGFDEIGEIVVSNAEGYAKTFSNISDGATETADMFDEAERTNQELLQQYANGGTASSSWNNGALPGGGALSTWSPSAATPELSAAPETIIDDPAATNQSQAGQSEALNALSGMSSALLSGVRGMLGSVQGPPEKDSPTPDPDKPIQHPGDVGPADTEPTATSPTEPEGNAVSAAAGAFGELVSGVAAGLAETSLDVLLPNPAESAVSAVADAIDGSTPYHL
ncbi:hypothetical protein AB0L63_26935 [Nocardia sp. NPDC051990]|uniref:hypothetical protein n=1 Tax=Nocardia sp. NPDC051990 TaxID=3155285 RepID=UPI00342FEBCD